MVLQDLIKNKLSNYNQGGIEYNNKTRVVGTYPNKYNVLLKHSMTRRFSPIILFDLLTNTLL